MTGPFGYISQPTKKNGATMHELANQAAESASIAKATFTPAPKGKLTRKWKAHLALLCTWVLGATTALVAFFVGNELVEAIGGFVWHVSLLILAGFIMRPPVQYKPIVEAKK